MAVATREQQVVDAVEKRLLIGGEWRDASGGGTIAVEDPATGETICEVADATPEDAKAALDAACAAQAEWAAHPPRERGEILRRAFELMGERADDLALLMTLEMGKAVAESKAEIAYASEFLRWNRRGGRAHRRPLRDHAERRRAAADDEAGRGALPADHALELPDRDGHPQDRPGRRGRLHDGRQAGQAHAAVDARAGPDLRRGRAARRRAEHRHREVGRRHHRPAARGPATAQAVVHRLDRGRQEADRGLGRGRCSRCRWSSAATPRSLCSATPTSMRRSRARCWPRCATSARPAPRPTASTCTSRWPRSSPASWPSAWRR